MIALAGTFRLPLDRLEEARPAMERIIKSSRGEPGCRDYGFSEDLLEPGLIRVFELWESVEALEDHYATDHFQKWAKEREDLQYFDRQIVRYEVSVLQST